MANFRQLNALQAQAYRPTGRSLAWVTVSVFGSEPMVTTFTSESGYEDPIEVPGAAISFPRQLSGGCLHALVQGHRSLGV